jgi:hypothetical protein
MVKMWLTGSDCLGLRRRALTAGSVMSESQFVLTTHSPLVISDAKDVLCYVLDDGELREHKGLYGLDANQVLLEVMDTDVRNSEVQRRLNQLPKHLQDGDLENAKGLFAALSNELPEGHLELAKAVLLIRKLELRRA